MFPILGLYSTLPLSILTIFSFLCISNLFSSYVNQAYIGPTEQPLIIVDRLNDLQSSIVYVLLFILPILIYPVPNPFHFSNHLYLMPMCSDSGSDIVQPESGFERKPSCSTCTIHSCTSNTTYAPNLAMIPTILS